MIIKTISLQYPLRGDDMWVSCVYSAKIEHISTPRGTRTLIEHHLAAVDYPHHGHTETFYVEEPPVNSTEYFLNTLIQDDCPELVEVEG